MAKQGRPTEAQLRRTRDLIERFHLSGFSAPRIREELLALRSDPIDLRVEQVKRHITAIRRDWAYARPEDVETTRRDLIGHYQSVMFRLASQAAPPHRASACSGRSRWLSHASPQRHEPPRAACNRVVYDQSVTETRRARLLAAGESWRDNEYGE